MDLAVPYGSFADEEVLWPGPDASFESMTMTAPEIVALVTALGSRACTGPAARAVRLSAIAVGNDKGNGKVNIECGSARTKLDIAKPLELTVFRR